MNQQNSTSTAKRIIACERRKWFLNLTSQMFFEHAERGPDMAMVDDWRSMGFVRRLEVARPGPLSGESLTVQVETERE